MGAVRTSGPGRPGWRVWRVRHLRQSGVEVLDVGGVPSGDVLVAPPASRPGRAAARPVPGQDGPRRRRPRRSRRRISASRDLLPRRAGPGAKAGLLGTGRASDCPPDQPLPGTRRLGPPATRRRRPRVRRPNPAGAGTSSRCTTSGSRFRQRPEPRVADHGCQPGHHLRSSGLASPIFIPGQQQLAGRDATDNTDQRVQISAAIPVPSKSVRVNRSGLRQSEERVDRVSAWAASADHGRTVQQSDRRVGVPAGQAEHSHLECHRPTAKMAEGCQGCQLLSDHPWHAWLKFDHFKGS